MANFELSTDTPLAAANVAAGDLFAFCDLTGPAWDSIEADDLLAAIARLADNANLALGAATVGTSGTNTFSVTSGTAPTTAPADCAQLYVADHEAGAGDARLHVRGEGGNPVSIGNNAVAVPAPAATTGASQVGRAFTVRSSDAVASTDTAGAAAGGDLNLTSGAAARNASGNANGGNVIVTAGAGIGTGVRGDVRMVATKLAIIPTGGSLGSSDVQITPSNGSRTDISTNGTSISIREGTTGRISTSGGTNPVRVYKGVALVDGSTNDVGPSVGFVRIADAVAGITQGDSGAGWVQNTAGESRVAGDVTNTTTTPAAITGLSATLIAGRKYAGELVVYCEETTAADGLRIDFDGGTATWTSFIAQGYITDTAGIRLLPQVTADDTDITDTTTTGAAMAVIKFAGVVNGAGTFIPRQAKEADAAGATLTIRANSHMTVRDVP